MSILTDIVNLLTENDNSITTSLLKIKVLASRLRNDSLYNWINKELFGYQAEDELPRYRIHGCNLIGNYINGNWKATQQALATMNLPDFVKEYVEKLEFYQSVSVLESYLKEKNSQTLQYSIPTEIVGIITDTYQKMGNPHMTVYSAYKQIGIGAVEQLLAEVRNIALDMMLKLEEEFGFEIKLEDLLKKKEKVNNKIQNIMSQTNITNSGDGNVINTGNDNKIKNEVSISKSDFESVKRTLKEHKVEEADIEELAEVIDEKPNYEKKLFGPKVNKWIQKMTGKALDGTWQIGVATAGALLAEILKQYYGM